MNIIGKDAGADTKFHDAATAGTRALFPSGNEVGAIARGTIRGIQGIPEIIGDDPLTLIKTYTQACRSTRDDVTSALEKKLRNILNKGEISYGQYKFTRTGDYSVRTEIVREGLLPQLLILETYPMNSDGCVTQALNDACKDFDTVMWLWERFAKEDIAKAKRFLQMHLDTYGDDLSALQHLRKEVVGYGKRGNCIDTRIHEIKQRAQLPELERAKGDYTKLVALSFTDSFPLDCHVRDEFDAAIKDVLPSMIDACAGDLARLVDLYSQPFCHHPLVSTAIKNAVMPLMAKCGDDFDALARLSDSVPSDVFGLIRDRAKALCSEDQARIVALVKSTLGSSLGEFVIFNSDALETCGVIDTDVLKNFLQLKKIWEVTHDATTRSIFIVRCKSLMTRYADEHREDFDELLALYEYIEDEEAQEKANDRSRSSIFHKPDAVEQCGQEISHLMGEAVQTSIPYAMARCEGDMAALITLYGRIPKVLRRNMITIFERAMSEIAPRDLAIQCDNDFDQLHQLSESYKPCPELYEAIRKACEGAERQIARNAVSNCDVSLEALMELHASLPPSSRSFPLSGVASEVITEAAQPIMKVLINECGDDLDALDALYEKTRHIFPMKGSPESFIPGIAKGKLDKLALEHQNDDLDELLLFYRGISYHFRDQIHPFIADRVTGLLPDMLAQCKGDVDKLIAIHGKLHIYFAPELNAVLREFLQSFIDSCHGDFGKLARLYAIMSPELQTIMNTSLHISQLN